MSITNLCQVPAMANFHFQQRARAESIVWDYLHILNDNLMAVFDGERQILFVKYVVCLNPRCPLCWCMATSQTGSRSFTEMAYTEDRSSASFIRLIIGALLSQEECVKKVMSTCINNTYINGGVLSTSKSWHWCFCAILKIPGDLNGAKSLFVDRIRHCIAFNKFDSHDCWWLCKCPVNQLSLSSLVKHMSVFLHQARNCWGAL